MLCCTSCIGDRWLSESIGSSRSTEIGECDYCKNGGRLLFKLGDLRDNFQSLVNIYSKDEGGKSLVEWFKEDWAMFPDLDFANSKQLLADILDDGEVVLKKFVPSKLCETEQLNKWEQLKAELMHENRFFPSTKFDEDRLRELLDQLLVKSSDFKPEWFRARIQKEEGEPYLIDQMGAPPKRLASQGRANPAGIPYLYLASNPETAVSEVRPHTGEFASVADFSIPTDLKFIDLRNPRFSVSPLMLGDENSIALLRGDLDFLIRLGYELTRPVLPHAVNIDYVPSQYLCEFIKKCGFHGVVYNSSVGGGINLALFEPASAASGSVKRYQVNKVSVSIVG